MKRLCVSRCLLGESCRYDGRSKGIDPALFGPDVEIVPFCPEMEAGLGCPREPIELVEGTEPPRVMGVRSRKDVTPALRAVCEAKAAELAKGPPVDAFILKARSPSCGKDSPLHGMDGRETGTAPGEWARVVAARFPSVPVYTEEEWTKDRVACPVRTIRLPGGAAMDLVWVEPGSFEMGSEAPVVFGDESPVHEVTLTKGYWIGKTAVTQRQWKSVMGSNPSCFKGDDLPVESVSWDDCQAFVKKVNACRPDLRLALPTEAQWEFAARGGTKSRGFRYAGSNVLKTVAWFGSNSRRATHPVGTKIPNELGLCDMSGNVWEWCSDFYGGYLSNAVSDPTGPSSGDERVRRGGSWNFKAALCRPTLRYGDIPSYRENDLGFRVVASARP